MSAVKDVFSAFFKKHRFGIGFAALIIVLSAMVFKGLMQIPQIEENRDTIAKLKDEVAYEQQRIEEIKELKDNVNSDEYIEKVAREKLGYIKQDEKVFIDVSKQDSSN